MKMLMLFHGIAIYTFFYQSKNKQGIFIPTPLNNNQTEESLSMQWRERDVSLLLTRGMERDESWSSMCARERDESWPSTCERETG